MDYLHKDLWMGPERAVQVSLDRQANVIVLDDRDYEHHRRGNSYRYRGGLAECFIHSTPRSELGRFRYCWCHGAVAIGLHMTSETPRSGGSHG